jgi:hypothetical protein
MDQCAEKLNLGKDVRKTVSGHKGASPRYTVKRSHKKIAKKSGTLLPSKGSYNTTPPSIEAHRDTEEDPQAAPGEHKPSGGYKGGKTTGKHPQKNAPHLEGEVALPEQSGSGDYEKKTNQVSQPGVPQYKTGGNGQFGAKGSIESDRHSYKIGSNGSTDSHSKEGSFQNNDGKEYSTADSMLKGVCQEQLSTCKNAATAQFQVRVGTFHGKTEDGASKSSHHAQLKATVKICIEEFDTCVKVDASARHERAARRELPAKEKKVMEHRQKECRQEFFTCKEQIDRKVNKETTASFRKDGKNQSYIRSHKEQVRYSYTKKCTSSYKRCHESASHSQKGTAHGHAKVSMDRHRLTAYGSADAADALTKGQNECADIYSKCVEAKAEANPDEKIGTDCVKEQIECLEKLNRKDRSMSSASLTPNAPATESLSTHVTAEMTSTTTECAHDTLSAGATATITEVASETEVRSTLATETLDANSAATECASATEDSSVSTMENRYASEEVLVPTFVAPELDGPSSTQTAEESAEATAPVAGYSVSEPIALQTGTPDSLSSTLKTGNLHAATETVSTECATTEELVSATVAISSTLEPAVESIAQTEILTTEARASNSDVVEATPVALDSASSILTTKVASTADVPAATETRIASEDLIASRATSQAPEPSSVAKNDELSSGLTPPSLAVNAEDCRDLYTKCVQAMNPEEKNGSTCVKLQKECFERLATKDIPKRLAMKDARKQSTRKGASKQSETEKVLQKADTEEVLQKSDTKESPKSETEESPKSETEESPKSETEESPKSETEEVLQKSDTKEVLEKSDTEKALNNGATSGKLAIEGAEPRPAIEYFPETTQIPKATESAADPQANGATSGKLAIEGAEPRPAIEYFPEATRIPTATESAVDAQAKGTTSGQLAIEGAEPRPAIEYFPETTRIPILPTMTEETPASRSLYQVLDVQSTASAAELKRSYRNMALRVRSSS